MSLILSLGTNQGDLVKNLNRTKKILSEQLSIIGESKIYSSKAVDYLDQPDFLNQVLEYKIPNINPTECMRYLLSVEEKLGRKRDIPKGPRSIDIDILFWGLEHINKPSLEVPHPRLFERSFIVLPLRELGYFNTLSQNFEFPDHFSNEAFALEND